MFPLSIDSPFFVPGIFMLVAGTFALAMASNALVRINSR